MVENLSSELIAGNSSLNETSMYKIEEQFKSSSQVNALYKASNGNIYFVLKGIKRTAGDLDKHTSLLHREYAILSSLDNPYIIHTNGLIHHPDVGECIILEYIDGRTLDCYIKEKRTDKERHRIVLQILEALEYIHKKGIIHADLKLSNIMVRNNGDYAVIIDFGLSDTDATILKNQGYTEKYASPEQKSGAKTDFSADIYSLGKIIQEIFPSRYRHIAVKCQNPNPSKRYKSIAGIRTAINKADKLRKLCAIVIPSALFISAACFIAGLFTSQQLIEPKVKEIRITSTDTVFIQQTDSTKPKLQPLLDEMGIEMETAFKQCIECCKQQQYYENAILECQNDFVMISYNISEKYKASHPEYEKELNSEYTNLYSIYKTDIDTAIQKIPYNH